MADALPTIDTSLVRKGFEAGRLRSLDDRRRQLAALRTMLDAEEDRFADALHADLGKSPFEAFTTEIGFTINEIDHALSNLDDWAAPSRVSVPLSLRPGRAEVRPEPLGTVLIIAPWNYPLQLVVAPLVAAIAAGNTAVLKPSEIAPATARAIAEVLPRYLDDEVVQVVLGAVAETTALLEQRWGHIFYTGNGTVGRIVMRAAAEHLTPVTLELGGKSPAIVDADADIEVSARRIAWGKFVNAGQTCVAPDYVLAHESIVDDLLAGLGSAVREFFGDDPSASADYGRIVNERHHERLVGLLDGGGYESVVTGGEHDATSRYLAPTVVSGVEPGAPLMQDEIFGPVLPVLTYSALDEAVSFVTARPKPLAMYVFSESDDTVDHLLDRISAGGATVNHVLLHLAVPDLPFGGVGESGLGAYHGERGFQTFSNLKPVLRRGTRLDPSFAYPPYSDLTKKILRKVL